MLKRLEVYADSGLLSFVLSVFLLFALSVVGRLLAMLVGAGETGMIPMMIGAVGLSVVGGAGLAIWLSRVFHPTTVREPMTTAESHKVAWAGLAAAVFAVVLGVVYAMIGTTTPVVWLSVAAALLVLAAAMIVDAVIDLAKTREHIAIDILRILMVALLATALVISMLQRAPLGSDQDVSPWVVWVTVALLVEALLAFAVDEFLTRRAHSRELPSHVVPAG
jgi:hypothetical protein